MNVKMLTTSLLLILVLFNVSPSFSVTREATSEQIESLVNAAGNGDLALVKKLIRDGIDLNNADSSGQTPLIRASYCGRFEIVRFLVDNKADLDTKNMGGYTALHWASTQNHLDVVNYLIEKGIDIKKAEENIPLLSLAAGRDLGIATALIKAGANVNGRSAESGQTPLVCAADRYSTEGTDLDIVPLLIENGADVNMHGQGSSKYSYLMKNGTALMCAVNKGNLKLIQFLIEKGANVNATDDDGKTALDWARHEGVSPEIIAFLIDHGAEEDLAAFFVDVNGMYMIVQPATGQVLGNGKIQDIPGVGIPKYVRDGQLLNTLRNGESQSIIMLTAQNFIRESDMAKPQYYGLTLHLPDLKLLKREPDPEYQADPIGSLNLNQQKFLADLDKGPFENQTVLFSSNGKFAIIAETMVKGSTQHVFPTMSFTKHPYCKTSGRFIAYDIQRNEEIGRYEIPGLQTDYRSRILLSSDGSFVFHATLAKSNQPKLFLVKIGSKSSIIEIEQDVVDTWMMAGVMFHAKRETLIKLPMMPKYDW